MFIIKLYYKQANDYKTTRIAHIFNTEAEAEKTIKARQTEAEKIKTEEMRKKGSLPSNGFYLKEAFAYIQNY